MGVISKDRGLGKPRQITYGKKGGVKGKVSSSGEEAGEKVFYTRHLDERSAFISSSCWDQIRCLRHRRSRVYCVCYGGVGIPLLPLCSQLFVKDRFIRRPHLIPFPNHRVLSIIPSRATFAFSLNTNRALDFSSFHIPHPQHTSLLPPFSPSPPSPITP